MRGPLPPHTPHRATATPHPLAIDRHRDGGWAESGRAELLAIEWVIYPVTADMGPVEILPGTQWIPDELALPGLGEPLAMRDSIDQILSARPDSGEFDGAPQRQPAFPLPQRRCFSRGGQTPACWARFVMLRKIASKRRRLRLVWAAEGSFPDGQLHPSHPEGTTRPHFNPVKLYLQPGDAYFRDNRTFHRGTPSSAKVSLPGCHNRHDRSRQ